MSSSTQSICCEMPRLRITKRKTSAEIIFGWDRFNSACAFGLLASFAVWCLAYFLAYKPEADDSGMEHQPGMEHHPGMEHF